MLICDYSFWYKTDNLGFSSKYQYEKKENQSIDDRLQYDLMVIASDLNVEYNDFNISITEIRINEFNKILSKIKYIPYLDFLKEYNLVGICIDYFFRRPTLEICNESIMLLMFLSASATEYSLEMANKGFVEVVLPFIHDSEDCYVPSSIFCLFNMICNEDLKSYFDGMDIKSFIDGCFKNMNPKIIVPATKFLSVYTMSETPEDILIMMTDLIPKFINFGDGKSVFLLRLIINIIGNVSIDLCNPNFGIVLEYINRMLETYPNEVLYILQVLIIKSPNQVYMIPNHLGLSVKMLMSKSNDVSLPNLCSYLSTIINYDDRSHEPLCLQNLLTWLESNYSEFNFGSKIKMALLVSTILTKIDPSLVSETSVFLLINSIEDSIQTEVELSDITYILESTLIFLQKYTKMYSIESFRFCIGSIIELILEVPGLQHFSQRLCDLISL